MRARAWLAAALLLASIAARAEEPLAERLPKQPLIVEQSADKSLGRPGGTLRMLIGSARDTRFLSVYGYSRLVGFGSDLELRPDILLSYENDHDRVYTFHLRPGHRWSDGAPFTAEDFRYYYEDMALNRELFPTGPEGPLVVNGKPARFEVLDETTVRYAWDAPNPGFLARLAAAAPLVIYRPAHYLKQFHKKYADPTALKALVAKAGARGWANLHARLDKLDKVDNPDLPTLDPWVLRTKPPAEQFEFVRNPYYHRVDQAGRQLPYIDAVTLSVANAKVIPLKVATGEADLQARYLGFGDYTLLKQAAERNGYAVNLWKGGRSSHLALYPNLTTSDPTWRALLRDVRFRRALSIGMDRHEINQVVYFGLARELADGVLPDGPLFDPSLDHRWIRHDPDEANRLLDEIGLTKRDSSGYRLLPDGRRAEIIVELSGDSAESADALALIRDHWAEIGIGLLTKTFQQDVFRNRVFAGQSIMTIFYGPDNGRPTAAIAPNEWAPVEEQSLQWSQWGNHEETAGKAGQACDLPAAQELLKLYHRWKATDDMAERAAIWKSLIAINAEQLFMLPLISEVPQPVVVSRRLVNLPVEAYWSWEPGAHFGIYRLDQAWLSDSPESPPSVPTQ